MGDEHALDHWLEVEGAGGDRTVHCPRCDRDRPLHDCLECRRYQTLALDPSGKHVYVDCDWGGDAAPPAEK